MASGHMEGGSRVTPFLWFNTQAEQAVEFYVSVISNSRITSVDRLDNGQAMSVTFVLDGRDYIALNGGPHYSLTPAFSLFVRCNSQEEVDMYWSRLSEGGEPSRCGWLKDKFGLSWQVVPTVLYGLLRHKDAEKAKRVMQAMMTMSKLDIKALEQA